MAHRGLCSSPTAWATRPGRRRGTVAFLARQHIVDRGGGERGRRRSTARRHLPGAVAGSGPGAAERDALDRCRHRTECRRAGTRRPLDIGDLAAGRAVRPRRAVAARFQGTRADAARRLTAPRSLCVMVETQSHHNFRGPCWPRPPATPYRIAPGPDNAKPQPRSEARLRRSKTCCISQTTPHTTHWNAIRSAVSSRSKGGVASAIAVHNDALRREQSNDATVKAVLLLARRPLNGG